MQRPTLSRRSFLQAAAVTPLAGSAAAAAVATKDRPNILFITMDELQPDAVGFMGNVKARTPNIDALAKRGVVFSRTYCQGPLCQPARASLITGQYVKQHGQSWNRINMNPAWPTMLKAMQRAGYTTAVVGKTHFGGALSMLKGTDPTHLDLRTMAPWTKQFGIDFLVEEFDHYVHKNPKIVTPYTEYLRKKGLLDTYRDETPGFLDGDPRPLWLGHPSSLADEDTLAAFVGDSAIEWLQGRHDDKRFFLWASFIEPHPPLMQNARWYDLFREADLVTGTRTLPDMPDNAWGDYLRRWTTETQSANMTDEQALLMARAYYSLVSEVDDKIGKLLKALAASPYADNTLIVFSADHGDMLGDHNLVYKNVFYRPSVQVPNVVVPPGGTTPRRVDVPIQSIDLTATFVDVAGGSLPTCAGRSLRPFLEGGSEKPRDVVYSELAGLQNKGNYFVMAATDRYRYVYDKLNRIACELYDLHADPREMHNLVAEPAYAGLRNDLQKDYILPFITA